MIEVLVQFFLVSLCVLIAYEVGKKQARTEFEEEKEEFYRTVRQLKEVMETQAIIDAANEALEDSN